jgi:hypothetical protein
MLFVKLTVAWLVNKSCALLRIQRYMNVVTNPPPPPRLYVELDGR